MILVRREFLPDLNDYPFCEIIRHVAAVVRNNRLEKEAVQEVIDALNDLAPDPRNGLSVLEDMKRELVLSRYNDFTLEELEQRLKK